MSKIRFICRLALLCLVAIVLPVLITGCAGKASGTSNVNESELVIPDFADAKTQFNFAKTYEGSILVAPDIERRKVQMSKAAQCYNKVIKNFPNDTVYVPLTYLELGDCEAQSNNMQGAIQYYQKAQSVSQDEFVQSRAEFSIAMIYSAEGQYEQAKSMFKAIIDRYGKSQSGRVRDVVSRASRQYYRVVDPTENKRNTDRPTGETMDFN